MENFHTNCRVSYPTVPMSYPSKKNNLFKMKKGSIAPPPMPMIHSADASASVMPLGRPTSCGTVTDCLANAEVRVNKATSTKMRASSPQPPSKQITPYATTTPTTLAPHKSSPIPKARSSGKQNTPHGAIRQK